MQAWSLQEEILVRLGADCASGRIHHTYLFEGRPGIGKKELAIEFAKRILCKGEEKGSLCDSCRKIESGHHPDVILIEPRDGKILADDLREYIKETVAPPFESEKKIFVINGFDLVTPEMQNMLLKSLEEPEKYVVNLLMASNVERILPTILSRCSVFKLKPAKRDVLKTYLEERYDISEARALYLAILSGGACHFAEELTEKSDFFDCKKEILERFTSYLKGRNEELIVLAKKLEECEDPHLFLDMLLIFLRDAMTFCQGAVSEVADPESERFYRALSEISSERLERSLFAIEEIKRHQKANVSLRNAWMALLD